MYAHHFVMMSTLYAATARRAENGHSGANDVSVRASSQLERLMDQGAVGGGERSLNSGSLGFGIPVVMKSSSLNLVGIIEEIRPHAVSILVREAVAEGTAVSIEFGAVSLESTIITCQPCGSKYLACAVMLDSGECDRRSAERFPVTLEIRIWRAISDSPLDAAVVDVSAQGLGLELSTSLDNGETVMIESASNTAFGVARHCTPLCDGRFHAGVEVFHVMPKEGGTSG